MMARSSAQRYLPASAPQAYRLDRSQGLLLATTSHVPLCSLLLASSLAAGMDVLDGERALGKMLAIFALLPDVDVSRDRSVDGGDGTLGLVDGVLLLASNEVLGPERASLGQEDVGSLSSMPFVSGIASLRGKAASVVSRRLR